MGFHQDGYDTLKKLPIKTKIVSLSSSLASWLRARLDCPC